MTTELVEIVHPNITMSIGKSEVCPLCLVDFVSDKNIVVPDCGHSMHIGCFCSLISYNLRDCSVCKKPIGNNSALCASGASSAYLARLARLEYLPGQAWLMGLLGDVFLRRFLLLDLRRLRLCMAGEVVRFIRFIRSYIQMIAIHGVN